MKRATNMEKSLPVELGTMDGFEETTETIDYTNASDATLVQRALQHDMRAYETLVRRHYQNAYRTALLLTHNADVALDISQEAFVRVHRNLKRFNPDKPFGAWLYQIVKNLCLNFLQRHRKRWRVFTDVFTEKAPSLPDAGDSPLNKLLKDEKRQQVWKALQKLSAAEREIIILKDFNDFTYEEIADALQIPMGTVMSRLFYARKKLARLLGGHHETD